MEAIDKNTILKTATDLYWGGFTYHANQRITSLRYFVGVFGLVAASLRLFPAEDGQLGRWGAVALAVFGWVVSILFMRLDFRNQQLVDAYENPVRLLQLSVGSVLAQHSVMPQSRFCAIQETDRAQQFLMTHGQIIPLMYLACGFVSICAAVYCASLSLCLSVTLFVILTTLLVAACFRDKKKEIVKLIPDAPISFEAAHK